MSTMAEACLVRIFPYVVKFLMTISRNIAAFKFVASVFWVTFQNVYDASDVRVCQISQAKLTASRKKTSAAKNMCCPFEFGPPGPIFALACASFIPKLYLRYG
jgi:hypothetical protein